MMQPSTKALAQMLAGNTKTSGQLVHARNVLAQANRMVDERMPDRLSPAAREQFFEQLALLELTIADAEDGDRAAEEEPEPAPRPATVSTGPAARGGAAYRQRRADSEGPRPRIRWSRIEPEPEMADAQLSSGYSRRPQTDDRAGTEPALSEARGTGPRRERLRLKPVQRPRRRRDRPTGLSGPPTPSGACTAGGALSERYGTVNWRLCAMAIALCFRSSARCRDHAIWG